MDQNTTPDLVLNAIDMSGKKQVKTIHIDRQGDLELQNSISKNKFAALVVSSKAMSIACDPWKAMLDPNFIEGQPGHKVIPLEDDLEAMVILLRIAHFQFTQVPTTLEFRSLLQVAVLTDKYQATHLVVPWVYKWMQDLEHLAIKNGSVLECKKTGGMNCANKKGKTLKDFMPPGIIERILEVRESTISLLLRHTYAQVQRYFTLDITRTTSRTVLGPLVPRKQIREPVCNERCDANTLGSLMIELYQIGLWPKLDSTGINVSIEDLAHDLEELTISRRSHLSDEPTLERKKIPAIVTEIHDGDRHTYYDGIGNLKKAVRDTIKSVLPTVLQDYHYNHLKTQRNKCALAKDEELVACLAK